MNRKGTYIAAHLRLLENIVVVIQLFLNKFNSSSFVSKVYPITSLNNFRGSCFDLPSKDRNACKDLHHSKYTNGMTNVTYKVLQLFNKHNIFFQSLPNIRSEGFSRLATHEKNLSSILGTRLVCRIGTFKDRLSECLAYPVTYDSP